jgi:hypothetical protein
MVGKRNVRRIGAWPNLRRISQVASLVLSTKVLPNFVRSVRASVGSIIIFGLLLLYAVSNGNMSYFSSVPWEEVPVGMAPGLVTVK